MKVYLSHNKYVFEQIQIKQTIYFINYFNVIFFIKSASHNKQVVYEHLMNNCFKIIPLSDFIST